MLDFDPDQPVPKATSAFFRDVEELFSTDRGERVLEEMANVFGVRRTDEKTAFEQGRSSVYWWICLQRQGARACAEGRLKVE